MTLFFYLWNIISESSLEIFERCYVEDLCCYLLAHDFCGKYETNCQNCLIYIVLIINPPTQAPRRFFWVTARQGRILLRLFFNSAFHPRENIWYRRHFFRIGWSLEKLVRSLWKMENFNVQRPLRWRHKTVTNHLARLNYVIIVGYQWIGKSLGI